VRLGENGYQHLRIEFSDNRVIDDIVGVVEIDEVTGESSQVDEQADEGYRASGVNGDLSGGDGWVHDILSVCSRVAPAGKPRQLLLLSPALAGRLFPPSKKIKIIATKRKVNFRGLFLFA